MTTQQVIDRTIGRLTKEIQDKTDAAVLATILSGVIQQAPVFTNIFGPTYGLDSENRALEARAAVLQKDIDAIKDIIGT